MPRGDLALKAFSALAFFPCAIAYFNIKDDRTRYSILVSAVVSALGFMATKAIIPMIKARTLRAGLSGKDINKKGSEAGEKDIPESLGLAPGLVFLVSPLKVIFLCEGGYRDQRRRRRRQQRHREKKNS
jgi:hypothetical protein